MLWRPFTTLASSLVNQISSIENSGSFWSLLVILCSKMRACAIGQVLLASGARGASLLVLGHMNSMGFLDAWSIIQRSLLVRPTSFQLLMQPVWELGWIGSGEQRKMRRWLDLVVINYLRRCPAVVLFAKSC